jgi:hypothetical protein
LFDLRADVDDIESKPSFHSPGLGGSGVHAERQDGKMPFGVSEKRLKRVRPKNAP